jgi:CheY-like chemotaxis protein
MTCVERLVLIVDDDHDVREAIGEILEDCGYRTLAAQNGVDALKTLRASPRPCLILLDVMMPIMDGPTFREAQRGDASLSDIPVVVISAHADAGRAAAEMDASGHLRKPVRADAVLAAVVKFCG